ncbi:MULTISPECIES: OmpA family protein [unclassified Corallococcus]|uniref:OmpA family protein n=1 Tax=unclassified Corallococcus TaxID=2685029 RepID=UPI001A8F468A|nr:MULTISPECIES: OmpA family protein [unclassified Corallococcus]MBN9684338.1 OmpA family protein [Corallococcus sp. NCSPR001]WAS84183.1 OmpA family protein [Corallococcus sp. NCRR]
MGPVWHRCARGAAALGLLLLATPARAQDATALPTFSLERLDPNPGLGPLALGNGELLAPGALRISLMAHYQHSPLRIANGLLEPSLVLSRTTGLVSLAVGVLPWLELQAQLPGVIHQSGADLSTSLSIASPSHSGLGAPRLAARFGLLGTSAPEAFHLALDLDMRLPVGGSGALARDRGVRGQGRVMMGKRWGAVAPALELGVLLRRSVSDSSVEGLNGVGNELRAGAGLTVGYAFRAEVSALGAYSFRQQRVSGELLGGLRYAPVRPWEFFAMGGAGLGSEPGVPRFRVLAGVALLLFDKPPRPPPENIVYELVTGLPRAPAEPQLEPEPTPSEPPPPEPPTPEPSATETDTDGDGVVDVLDACIHEKGTREHGGCPETGDPLVTLTRERLILHGQVFFEVGVTTLPDRSRVLDQVARVLIEHPEVERVVIEGHTDAEGSSASNQRLSLARAEAVRDYLLRKGVPAHRLEARGLGARRPLGSNGTQAGRGENRRAELLLLLGEPTSDRSIPAPPLP